MNFNENDIIKLKKEDYVRSYKIKDSYNEERIHMTPLDRGVSIVGDYGSIYLLSSCVEAKLNQIEEEVGICSELFDEVCKMQHFLIANKEPLEKICKAELIEDFIFEDFKVVKGITYPSSYDFNKQILYNGKGVTNLERLKRTIWNNVQELLTSRRQIINLNNKIDTVLSDDDYLEGNEIIESFNENYNKIENDKLCVLQEIETLIDNKEQILNEVESCLYRQKFNVNRNISEGYSWYLMRHYSWDDYATYCYIRDAYKNEELKNKLIAFR